MHATDDTAKPVALLARAGAARDRLREALVAAGGRIVLEEDPNQLEPSALAVSASDRGLPYRAEAREISSAA